MNSKTRKYMGQFLSTAITVIAVGLVLNRMNWPRFWVALRNLDGIIYLGGLVVLAFTVMLQTYRWKLCMGPKHKIPYRMLLKLTTIGYFFNNFFLSFFGGDLFRGVRIYPLIGKTHTAFSLLLARITNLWGALLIPAPFVFIYRSFLFSHTALMMMWWASISAWIALLAAPGLLRWKGDTLKLPSDQRRVLEKKNIYLVGISSICFQVVGIVVHYFYVKALGLPLSFLELFLIIPAVNILTSLPISINGVGVREWAFIFGLGFFGITAEQALALSLLSYAGSIHISIIGGFLYLFEKRRS